MNYVVPADQNTKRYINTRNLPENKKYMRSPKTWFEIMKNWKFDTESKPSRQQHCWGQLEYWEEFWRPEETYCLLDSNKRPTFKAGVENPQKEYNHNDYNRRPDLLIINQKKKGGELSFKIGFRPLSSTPTEKRKRKKLTSTEILPVNWKVVQNEGDNDIFCEWHVGNGPQRLWEGDKKS